MESKIDPPICPYCGSIAIFSSTYDIYNTDYGMVWLCPNFPTCDSYVGAHKSDNRPKGSMANKELRKWRMRAHESFDPLWKRKIMDRGDAYQYMQSLMHLDPDLCHIGMFDIDQCKELIEKLKWYSPYPINIDTGLNYS